MSKRGKPPGPISSALRELAVEDTCLIEGLSHGQYRSIWRQATRLGITVKLDTETPHKTKVTRTS